MSSLFLLSEAQGERRRLAGGREQRDEETQEMAEAVISLPATRFGAGHTAEISSFGEQVSLCGGGVRARSPPLVEQIEKETEPLKLAERKRKATGWDAVFRRSRTSPDN